MKGSCQNTTQTPLAKGLRTFNSLNVTVVSAHHVPTKLLSHPACTLELNKHRVGRTQTYEGSDPFWSEEFLLE